ncbi:Mitochondrial translocator assembly and maintenance protein 41 [Gnomoniopsis sp. IMI 355080]|nr:Mitochondrial translocator assembly and maintenance protein 41 [Gnomoniopsis sp. IMI 355080]
MSSLRLVARRATVQPVHNLSPVGHPYRRLQPIPAASRSFIVSSQLRDDVRSTAKEAVSGPNDQSTEQDQPTGEASQSSEEYKRQEDAKVFSEATKQTPSKSGASRAQSTKVDSSSVLGEPKDRPSRPVKSVSSSSKVNKSEGSSTANSSIDDWEANPNFNIQDFSELPHSNFGVNQHIIINAEFKEALRQIPWQFRAPVRYAFAYGSGVFPQSKADGQVASAADIARVHPKAPPAVQKAQNGTPKMIDFIFGVTFTQHWHSLNLNQHRDHYSALGSLGSGAVSYVQDRMGAGVYFNTHVAVNGTLIKYGVVNIDTLCRDLTEWDTLYLAGRLHKPVKILRDDPRVRLANQMNLLSALRTALLLLPEKFTEMELYNTIAGISYLGDPRMTLPTENPQKVSNIVGNNFVNFYRLYDPLLQALPNVSFDTKAKGKEFNRTIRQDMDPVRRGNMVRRLPKAFRSKLYFQYQRKFEIPQVEFDAMMETDASSGSSKQVSGSGGFEMRIANDDPAELRSHVRKIIKNTIGWPSTTQSLKGILTGGVKKSLGYVWEKVEKYRDGVAKAAAASKEDAKNIKEDAKELSNQAKSDSNAEKRKKD